MGSNFKKLAIAAGALALTSACVSKYAFVSAPPAPITETQQALKSLRPALAVRGTSCLMCHASVKANMISDFGSGDPYFLDTAGGGLSSGSYYFNHDFLSWQTAAIEGSLIVPRVVIERSTNAGQLNTVDPERALPSVTLADFLQKPLRGDVNGNDVGNRGAMAAGVTNIQEKSSIYIGALTGSEILSMAPTLASDPTGLPSATLAAKALSSARISGLVLDEQQKYLTHRGTITCIGDVVVRGTLLLNSPVIETNDEGCRLHVAGSVFIQGNVTLSGRFPAGTQTLQIAASKAILVGFSTATLRNRLCLPGTPNAAWTLPYAHTRGGSSPEVRRQDIYEDSLKIGSVLRDADQEGTAPQYTRLLLNAPEVHSRYDAHFTGAVIGEIVIFRIGKFDFAFDSVFEKATVFPFIPREVLRIGN